MDNITIPIKVRVIAALCGLAFGAGLVIVMLINSLSIWKSVPMWLAVALVVVSAFSLLVIYALEKKRRHKE